MSDAADIEDPAAEDEPFFSFGVSFECRRDQLFSLSELISRITAGVALEGVSVRTSITPVQITQITSIADLFAGYAEHGEVEDWGDGGEEELDENE